MTKREDFAGGLALILVGTMAALILSPVLLIAAGVVVAAIAGTAIGLYQWVSPVFGFIIGVLT